LSKLLRNSLLVSFLSLGGAFLNFLSQIVIAGYFGANAERDAFFAASVIPAYINTIVAGSLGVVFLPKLIDARVNKQVTEVELISGVAGFTLLFLALLGLGLAAFSNLLVGWLFPGFNTEESRITALLIQVLCPAIIFQSYTSILSCVYHAEGKFLIPAGAHLITPLVNIALVTLLYDHLGIVSLAIGTSLGYTIALLIVQARIPIKYRFQPLLFLRSTAVAGCLRESIPWLLGGFVYRANTIVERMVASRFPAGVISYLGYAGGLITTLSLITMNGIATTIFPRLAEAWSARDRTKLQDLFGISLKFTFALCVPIIISILAFSDTIIKVLFERGAFSSSDTTHVAALLTINTGAFIFICMNTIPGKLLYATGTSKLAIANGIIEVAIYIVAAFVLSDLFSYTGIAYAQILSTMCSTLFAALILQMRFGVFNGQGLAGDMMKIVICGLVSYLVMISYKLWIDKATLVITITLGGAGLAIYLLMVIHFLKEGRMIKNLLIAKIQSFYTS